LICNLKTTQCKVLIALSISLALATVWIVYRLPTSILPILIFLQWMPLILKSRPIPFLGRAWLTAAVALLLFAVVAGVFLLLLRS